MTHVDGAFDHHLLHARRQGKQPHQIGDMAARLVNNPGQRFLAMPVILDKPLISLRFFNGIEILALDILHQRDFQRRRIGEVADDHRHFVQLRTLGCPPAPLAGDDLVAGTGRTDDNGLDQPTCGDRLGKLFERRIVEMAARLAGMRCQCTDRQHAQSGSRRGTAADRCFALDVAHQCAQPAAETRTRLAGEIGVAHAAAALAVIADAPPPGGSSRWMNSRARAMYASEPGHR
jgi:hypothetical protein